MEETHSRSKGRQSPRHLTPLHGAPSTPRSPRCTVRCIPRRQMYPQAAPSILPPQQAEPPQSLILRRDPMLPMERPAAGSGRRGWAFWGGTAPLPPPLVHYRCTSPSSRARAASEAHQHCSELGARVGAGVGVQGVGRRTRQAPTWASLVQSRNFFTSCNLRLVSSHNSMTYRCLR